MSCACLSELAIHSQTTSLVKAATSTTPSSGPAVQRKDRALTYLYVGLRGIPIPARSAFAIAFTLLHIRPRILHVVCANLEWEAVEESIADLRQIGPSWIK